MEIFLDVYFNGCRNNRESWNYLNRLVHKLKKRKTFFGSIRHCFDIINRTLIDVSKSIEKQYLSILSNDTTRGRSKVCTKKHSSEKFQIVFTCDQHI